MKRILTAALALLCVLGQAAGPVPPYPNRVYQTFVPTGNSTLTATTSSSNAALPSLGPVALLCNTSPSYTAYVAFGIDNTIVATTAASFALLPNMCATLDATGYSYIAGITASNSAAVSIAIGSGSPSIAMLGGGSGGGVSDVIAGTGLSGGGSSSPVTVSLATPVTAAHGGTGSTSVPAAGTVAVGNAGGTAYAPVAVSGDCTLTSAGAITCLETNGSPFTDLATGYSTSHQITSTATTGTAPFVIASTTQVANLNAATAGSATAATNIAGGAASDIPYQTGSATTSFVTPVNGAVLNTSSSGVPSETATPTLGVNGTTTGQLKLATSTGSGASTTITPSAITSAATITLPATTDTVVGRATTDTLTNKSIAGSEINSSVVGATYGGTGINNGSNTLTLAGSLTTTGSATPTLAFGSTGYTYTFPGSTSTLAILGANTFTGTQTFADSGTWGSSGISGTTLNNTVVGGSTAAAITGTTITANSHVTFEGVTSTGATGSGKLVFQTSPTLTTPVIGAATGTSLSVSGQLTSTVSTGTAPLVVSSTTQVANLNAATAGASTNVAGGVANDIPYQTGAATTSFIAPINGAILNTNSSGVPAETATPVLGVNATTTGTLGLATSTASGATTTIQPANITTAATITLPSITGTLPLLSANTFTGTQTFTDNGYWGSGGINNAAQVTVLNPTANYGMIIDNTTATAANMFGLQIEAPNVSTGSGSGYYLKMQHGAGPTNDFYVLGNGTMAAGGTITAGAEQTDNVQIAGGGSGGSITTSGGTIALGSGGGANTTFGDTNVNVTNTLNAGKGSTDYLELSGGSTGATINTNGGNITITPATTHSGTVTFADGSTLASTGFLTNSAAYTTSGTAAPWALTYTNSYSSTASGVTGFSLTPTMTSTGASSGNMSVINFLPTIGNSANNIGIARGTLLGLSEPSGYTGTITTAETLELSSPNMAGNAATNSYNMVVDANTNGNGITSGSVTNAGAYLAGPSAAAGVGGTVTDITADVLMPTGNAAGTTAYGIFISGSGGASNTANYSLYDNSSANITLNNAASSAAVVSIASGTTFSGTVHIADSATSNTGTIDIGATGATVNIGGAVALTNLASSTSALDYVCYNGSTHALTYDSSGTCLASLEELKNNLGYIDPTQGLNEIMALKPFWGTYKDEQTGISHPTDAATGQVVQEVQPFLGAHQVESVDPRLAAYDADTGTLHGVRYQQLTAVLTAAIQAQQAQIASLQAQITSLQALSTRAVTALPTLASPGESFTAPSAPTPVAGAPAVVPSQAATPAANDPSSSSAPAAVSQ